MYCGMCGFLFVFMCQYFQNVRLGRCPGVGCTLLPPGPLRLLEAGMEPERSVRGRVYQQGGSTHRALGWRTRHLCRVKGGRGAGGEGVCRMQRNVDGEGDCGLDQQRSQS